MATAATGCIASVSRFFVHRNATPAMTPSPTTPPTTPAMMGNRLPPLPSSSFAAAAVFSSSASSFCVVSGVSSATLGDTSSAAAAVTPESCLICSRSTWGLVPGENTSSISTSTEAPALSRTRWEERRGGGPAGGGGGRARSRSREQGGYRRCRQQRYREALRFGGVVRKQGEGIVGAGRVVNSADGLLCSVGGGCEQGQVPQVRVKAHSNALPVRRREGPRARITEWAPSW
mmetsp:Transcript_30767/g.63669  ORF Transcript_30767/g.63669 Transcript_30767/m.63669 type:complete len:232 (+) Transcript_30767:175-870(+)